MGWDADAQALDVTHIRYPHVEHDVTFLTAERDRLGQILSLSLTTGWVGSDVVSSP